MAIVATGWDMYDPRNSLKAEAAEAISMGEGCYINNDGLIYICDNIVTDKCHGYALTDAADGDMLVLVTHGRLRVQTAQTQGNKAYSGNFAGGTAPSTTFVTGIVVGTAIEEYLVWVHIEPSLSA